MPTFDSPHHRYFQSKHGRWSGRIRMEITDRRRLRASCLRFRDQWSLRCVAVVSRVPALVLSTTVDYATHGQQNTVLHTTRMSCLGITLFRSQETIHLNDDGLSLELTGVQSFFPRLWKSVEWKAHGTVLPDNDGALYHIPCFGEMMEQKTQMTPTGLELAQTTAFSKATIILKWRGML